MLMLVVAFWPHWSGAPRVRLTSLEQTVQLAVANCLDQFVMPWCVLGTEIGQRQRYPQDAVVGPGRQS